MSTIMKKAPKVVIIEDNDDVRENTEELLRLAQYEVFPAKCGKEGIRIVNSEMPDLIICDIMMPELDGYGVLHILSKSPLTARIPFIFLTAKTEKSDIRKGMSLGADDYLVKPFEETDLLNAIEVRLKKNAVRNSYDGTSDGFDLFLKDARQALMLEDLCQDKKPRIYKKKSVIYTEGEYPAHVYFVKSGSVKTTRSHPDGKELITEIHKSNDFFGYEALLERIPYIDTSVAMEESILIPITSDDFLTLLHAQPAVSLSFISLLCKKVSKKESRLLHLAYNSVRQRTAEALLQLCAKQTEPMSISREDLSKIVGTASESVIRILSDFKEEKLIHIDNSKIIILNPEGLKQVIRWNIAR